MARDRITFAKRQRETRKKQKAEEKRALRRNRKEPADDVVVDPCPGLPRPGGERGVRA